MAQVDARCPFLVPVMADRLWIYPTSEYCRRPDAGVRVPAPETFLRFCASPSYLRCLGYQASTGCEPGPGA